MSSVLEQVPELDAIIVPVSGGGMISGIAVAASALKPGIRIIAAEPCGRQVWAFIRPTSYIVALFIHSLAGYGLFDGDGVGVWGAGLAAGVTCCASSYGRYAVSMKVGQGVHSSMLCSYQILCFHNERACAGRCGGCSGQSGTRHPGALA